MALRNRVAETTTNLEITTKYSSAFCIRMIALPAAITTTITIIVRFLVLCLLPMMA